MIGTQVSHYRIEERLGRGAMGVVYRARDLDLDRDVALKFIGDDLLGSPEARRRFEAEAKAVAALRNDHICTIYEIGHESSPEGERTWLAMEFVQGESLRQRLDRGPLPLDEALDLAAQAADGLAHAHARGIVHRDIKPANLMIDGEGRLVIMDFGLALRADATRLTQPGLVSGTIAYMAPEQARGEEVDARSDLWALGATLHEMLSGKPAFDGENLGAVYQRIQEGAPAPPPQDLPAPLKELLAALLEKDPQRRPTDAAEVREILRALQSGEEKVTVVLSRPAAPAPARRKLHAVALGLVLLVAAALAWWQPWRHGPPAVASVAVLPLANLGGDADQDEFVDGLTGEIIGTLGQAQALRVISRHSTFRYKGSDRPLAEIARELDVQAVVEGSVQVVGEEIRVQAELVDVAQDRVLWSRSFSGRLEEVLALQNRIALDLLDGIQARLSGDERRRLQAAPVIDPAAYRAYLRGRQRLQEWSFGWKEAEKHLLEAVDIDPSFGTPYALLALLYERQGWFDPEKQPRARAALAKALELAPDQAETWVTQGVLLHRQQLDWEGADRAYRRALALDPNNALVLDEYATYLTLAHRYDQALDLQHQAIARDPFAEAPRRNLLFLLLTSGRYGEGVREGEAMQAEGELGFYESQHLAHCYLFAGQKEQALALTDSLRAVNPSYGFGLVGLLAAAGRRDQADSLRARVHELGRQGHIASTDVDMIDYGYHVATGDYEAAFAILERTAEEGPALLFFYNCEPDMPPAMRRDPRYTELMEKVGAPLLPGA